jgi:hypothetical protein
MFNPCTPIKLDPNTFPELPKPFASVARVTSR